MGSALNMTPQWPAKTDMRSERTWEFDQTMQVRIDGARAASARRVEIIVEPDAATIYA